MDLRKKQQVHEDARKMHRAEVLLRKVGKMVKATDLVRRVDRQGGHIDWVQKVLGPREAENGTIIDELLQAGASGHKRAWTNVETNSASRGRQSSCKRGRKRSIERSGVRRPTSIDVCGVEEVAST